MKKGFSLAEILVALMIIGVIAGMTIPALQKDAMTRTTVTNLKKIYSELNQATSLAMTHNETDKFYRTDCWGSKANFYNNFVNKYLNVVQVCEAGDQAPCWGSDWDRSDDKVFLLNSGIAVSFANIDEWVYDMKILVDTNGPKSPNKDGVDRFALNITGEGVVYAGPQPGATDTTFYSTAKSKCSGSNMSPDYCAALIVMDGWQIKY